MEATVLVGVSPCNRYALKIGAGVDFVTLDLRELHSRYRTVRWKLWHQCHETAAHRLLAEAADRVREWSAESN